VKTAGTSRPFLRLRLAKRTFRKKVNASLQLSRRDHLKVTIGSIASERRAAAQSVTSV
jgi:hypothetical protein